jgi:hypothetical protein
VSELAHRIMDELRRQPLHFSEVVEAHLDVPWRDFLYAWGEVRSADVLARDDAGRYLIPTVASSPSPATGPAIP